MLWPASTQAANYPAGNEQPDTGYAPATPGATLFHDHTGHARPPMSRRQHQEFAAAVDLDAFRKLAVFDQGRVKILDTLAREHVTAVYGKARWRDFTWDTFDLADRKEQEKFTYDPVFTYLDLVFNPAYYADKPILYVEVLPYRERLLAHKDPETREAWKKLGRISWEIFSDPRVQAIYRGDKASQFDMNARDQLFSAANAFLHSADRLLMVSPAPGEDYWAHVTGPLPQAEGETVILPTAAGGVRPAAPADLWSNLRDAWTRGDADTVNFLLAALVNQLPQINPATYPAGYRLDLEYLYNVTGKFTIGYWLYAVSTLSLILALGTGRRWLLATGVVLLVVGLAAHTGSFAIRAVLSGRWAIHNQYESFIAISLFAVAVGVVFMFLKKLWVVGAAAAAMGAVSLMVANLWAIPSHEVGQVAGILDTSRILYVHVNMVLVSYGLIALSFFVSLAYLYAHYVKGREATAFAAASVGRLDAATALVGGSTGSEATPTKVRTPGRKKLLADLDQTQLTLMQLAFWLLGVGILLGAYWADHAWGRWWAWDPKETWALITWIVYLIAIHARFGVRDRGLVTAWLSVAGFVVMLWCYWGVNLLLAGLHSYA
ncbi:MAG: cytochrome c biogenesis protein CcsA [Planctomycetota bacterium]